MNDKDTLLIVPKFILAIMIIYLRTFESFHMVKLHVFSFVSMDLGIKGVDLLNNIIYKTLTTNRNVRISA